MIMTKIMILAGVVFVTRFLFLEPRIPLRPGDKLQRLLSYSGPAVLSVIWAPIVFLPEQRLWIDWHNPYLLAAFLAGVLAWKTRNVLLTTVGSMAAFLVLHLWVFA